jgi:hypothetical protein
MPGIIPPGGGAGTDNAAVNPQVEFVNQVASQTGLDPRVVYAWTVAEGAYAPGGTGGFNFLNLRPYKPNQTGGDVGVIGVSSGNFDQFKDLPSAIASTVGRIKQPFLWRILSPVLSRKSSPREQIDAIATSGWDSGHYTDSSGVVGGKLVADFTGRYGASALGSGSESQPLPEAGGGASGDQTKLTNPLTGWVNQLTGWLTDTAGYALVYGALVMFAIVLAIFGLLGLLGVHPRTVMAGAARAAAVAA